MAPDDVITLREFAGLAERVAKVEEHKASRRDVDGLADDVRDLKDEVKSLRRSIMGFSFTVAGSAVVIAFAVLQSTGG